MRRLLTRRPKSLAGLLALVIAWLLYAWQSGWLDTARQAAETNQPGLYTVSRFTDGDTITVNMNGRQEKIRFIGVDTPETHKPNAPVQCYGPAAAAYTKNTIGNHKVRLASDPESTNRDRYNRLLRYVYLDDGRFMNKLLIENGYGFYYPYFPFTKSGEFSEAQKSAQDAVKGLWANCQPRSTDGGGYISNDI